MDQTFTIGSDERADIVIADSSIQPHHAIIRLAADGKLVPGSGVVGMTRKGKPCELPYPALQSGDVIEFGAVQFTAEEILEALRFKHPGLKAHLDSSSNNPPRVRTKRQLPVQALALGILGAIALGFAYYDRKQQIDSIDYLDESTEHLSQQMNSSLADASSIRAIRSALRMNFDQAITLSDRWISDRKLGTLRYIEEVGEKLKGRERQFGLPEGG